MSNVFGNRGGGGGFVNPATEILDMNNYKITQVGQALTTGDVVGYGQNALFSSVNMNGAWDIPNTQPSSPNDVNTYNLSARGGLINVTTTPSLPSGIFKFTLLRTLPFTTSYEVNIPVPSGYISWPDLNDFFINSFNSQTIADGYPFITFTGGFVTTPAPFRFTVTVQNGQAQTNGWLLNYIVGSTLPGTVYSVFGINGVAVLNYGALGIGTPLTLQSQVGWFSGTSSNPVQNGSPYVYSTSQDKWYCSDNLYTPNFQSYMDFNNSSYNLFQNGIGRISSNAFSTLLTAPNVITNCSVNNNGIGLIVDTVARFSALSGGATTIKSADDQTNMTMTNTDVIMSQNGFTKFLMNEDQLIGTSLWGPSGSGRIELVNARINLRQNSVNRFVINNAETYSYSPSLLNNYYISDNAITLNYNNAGRVSVGSTTTSLLSPTGSNLNLADSSYSLYINNSLRFASDAVETDIVSPDINVKMTLATNNIHLETSINSYLDMTDTIFRVRQNNGTRLYIDSTNGSTLYGIGSSVSLLRLGDNSIDLGLSGSFKSLYSLSQWTVQNNNTVQLLVDATKTRLISPDNTNFLDINNTGLVYTQAGVGRISSTASSTYLLAANSTTLCSVSNSGVGLTVDTVARFTAASGGNTTIKSFDNTTTVTLAGDAFTAATTAGTLLVNSDFSYTKGAQLRIHADASHSQLLSPNGLQAVEANNTGVQINLGTDNYKLPTTRGTVGQVLTYSGVNTTWASLGASVNAGFSLFNPLLSTAVSSTGSKPYWYIVMVPCNCILTGFKTVISTGSDPFHVGIYRGKTTNSALTVLDLLAPIVTVAGGGFYSGAFALQSGRSNSYVAGEYITVMYHSQGSTNVFGNSIGIADTDLSYTSIANYGNAAPPANLGSVAVSATNVNRLAIEFY